MTFSLDTNVMIDVLNGQRLIARERYDVALASGEQLVTSAVAAHELIYGAMISPRPDVHLANAERLLADLEIIPWSYEDGIATARLRLALKRKGSTIGAADSFIAGQALARGWVVVSANLRHFERVEGLQVIDWTAPAENP